MDHDASSYLLGPFHRIVTMRGLPAKGSLRDDDLEVVSDGAIRVQDGVIREVGSFERMARERGRGANSGLVGHTASGTAVLEIPASQRPLVLLPGWIDAHTHLCYAGSRAADYTRRISGMSYLDILREGGGILESVRASVKASSEQLAELLRDRLLRHLGEGVTTVEVKTGYGLEPDQELRMLRVIGEVTTASGNGDPGERQLPDVIPTCLAAHAVPPGSTPMRTVERLIDELLPALKSQDACRRVDIFAEHEAFDPPAARRYLMEAARAGFDLTVHAGQFSSDGVRVAVEFGARSVDHLEAVDEASIRALAGSGTVAVALPGASMGLGMPYAPARALLDAGAALAIATDWNPGSAPMGDLLLQAAVLGAAERLTMAETFAGITVRAAAALGLSDRGSVEPGLRADLIAFHTDDPREILYQQGRLKPTFVWQSGRRVP